MSFEQKEKKDEDVDETVYLAFFTNSFDKRLGLFQRLRYCWKLLRSGIPFNDMVCLNKKTADILAKDLLKFSRNKGFDHENKKRFRKQ